MRTVVAAVLLSFATGSPLVVAAQPRPPQAAPAVALTAEQRREVIANAQRVIQQRFIYADKRQPLIDALNASLAAGRYDTASPQDFSGRVTDDLKRIGTDRHLGLPYRPDAAAAETRAQADAEAVERFRTEQARRVNHGLSKMEILDGNVRYLRVDGFEWIPDQSGRAWDEAARFLKEGDAVIIDLRDNGGGNGAAVRYAISHFMPARDEQLLLTFRPVGQEVEQSRVLSYLPSGRITAPLYVLSSRFTGSAAEEFLQHVKGFKLGQIVGERSGGLGNNNDVVSVGHGFYLNLGVSAPVQPLLPAWEGEGIAPDVEAPSRFALVKAQEVALMRLRESATGSRRAEIDWALAGVRASQAPGTPTAAQVASYVGRYGERVIRLENGTLLYRREGRPELRLTPMTDTLFAIEDGPPARIRFRPGGLTMLYRDGAEVDAPRDR